MYNENLPSGESLDNMSIVFFNLAGGVNYRYQTERNSLNVGAGFFNLMRPDQAFLENSDPIRLPVRSSVYADLWLGLSDRVRWNLTGNAQWQEIGRASCRESGWVSVGGRTGRRKR